MLICIVHQKACKPGLPNCQRVDIKVPADVATKDALLKSQRQVSKMVDAITDARALIKKRSYKKANALLGRALKK